jgi:hypothetical protein
MESPYTSTSCSSHSRALASAVKDSRVPRNTTRVRAVGAP